MSTERDPPRLAAGGEGVPAALSTALRTARARVPADAVLSAVAARLPGFGGGGGPGPRSPDSPSGGPGTAGALGGKTASVVASAGSSLWTAIGAGAALGVVVCAASLVVPAGAPPASAPATAVSSPRVAGPEVAALPAVSASAEASEPVRRTSPLPPAVRGAGGGETAAPAVPVDSAPLVTERESEYLRRAHSLLSGSPAQALALAEAHPGLYPDGKLAQEREVIAIHALHALGRTAEARARAGQFLTRFPGSAHRRRIEALWPGWTGAGSDGSARPVDSPPDPVPRGP